MAFTSAKGKYRFTLNVYAKSPFNATLKAISFAGACAIGECSCVSESRRPGYVIFLGCTADLGAYSLDSI